jgi:3-oxoacyl-[acyl-carrier-protein] synthase III
MIEGTGIIQRHHTLPPVLRQEGDPLIPPEEADRQVGIAASLTRTALQANGWDGADLLIVTSSIPPSDDFPAAVAEASGLSQTTPRYYLLACNGAVGALQDILRDGNLRDARVVITAIEGLSLGVDFTDPAPAAIFGNGAASMAFRPRAITFHAGQTTIVPDTLGVIKLPKTYDLPPAGDEQDLLPWYSLEPGSEEIFACTADGVMTTLPISDHPHRAEMKGIPTARFFAKCVPPVVQQVLETCKEEGLAMPDPVFGIFHQPSAGVLGLVNRNLEKMSASAGLPRLEIPWVMDKVGMGNVSSATTLIAWAHLEQQGLVPRGQVVNITGFGVGASVTSMMVEL